MRLAVLFTGGKDSCLALYKKHKEVVCLVSMISQNLDSYMFHTPNLEILKLQAESLRLPLIIGETKGEKEKELIDLKNLIKKAVKKYKIDGIVTGALFSKYQASRIKKICDELRIICINPLWHMSQEQEMRELFKNNFEFILVKIAAEGLNKKWLGKIITFEDLKKLIELNRKYGLNISFEGGEAESLVLNCPLFKKRIRIIDYEIKMESENTGKVVIKKIR